MVFEEKIPAAIRRKFVDKVGAIAMQLNIYPEWIMGVINSESGFNPQAVNKQPGDSSDPYTRAATRATGLIQFMPKTAAALGTTTQKLYKMNAIDQLDYVYLYYKQWAKYIRSYEDLYLATFYPKALVQQWNGSKAFPQAVYNQNKGVDSNKDGVLTVSDFRAFVLKKIPTQYLAIFEKKKEAGQPVSDGLG